MPYSGNTKVDQTRAKYLGEAVEDYIVPLVNSPAYLKYSNERKAKALRDALSELRGSVNDYIKENRINELEFKRAAYFRQPKYIKKILRSEGKDWETISKRLKE